LFEALNFRFFCTFDGQDVIGFAKVL
jgi:hypothetical protein